RFTRAWRFEWRVKTAPRSRTTFLQQGREIAPVLDAESADVAHDTRKPRQCLERQQGGKQIRHVGIVAKVNTPWDALKTEAPQNGGDFGIRRAATPRG